VIEIRVIEIKMDDRFPPATYFHYSPSGIHSPHHSNPLFPLITELRSTGILGNVIMEIQVGLIPCGKLRCTQAMGLRVSLELENPII